MKQNLQLPVSIWKAIPTCYYRNKGEVENIHLYIWYMRILPAMQYFHIVCYGYLCSIY